jgi:hypothetical protein
MNAFQALHFSNGFAPCIIVVRIPARLYLDLSPMLEG